MELKKYLDICINSYYIIQAFCHKLFFQETSFVNSFSREILGFLVTLFRFPVFLMVFKNCSCLLFTILVNGHCRWFWGKIKHFWRIKPFKIYPILFLQSHIDWTFKCQFKLNSAVIGKSIRKKLRNDKKVCDEGGWRESKKSPISWGECRIPQFIHTAIQTRAPHFENLIAKGVEIRRTDGLSSLLTD